MSLNTLPTLSQHRSLRYFSFAMLYVAQGINLKKQLMQVAELENANPAAVGALAA